MKDLAELLHHLTDQQLVECCDSLGAIETKKEGMYLGDTVKRLREEVGDEQFYSFEKLLNEECRKRWHNDHR